MIARTAALAARPAVDLLDSIADEIDGEMRQALYVTPDEADAGALVDAGLSAVCAADVAMIDRAAHDATLADQAVVVVAPRDGSTVAYLVREVPGVDVRELSLPATYGSVVAMLGHRPSVLGRSWTEDEAAAKREAWIAWASTQARSVGDAGGLVRSFVSSSSHCGQRTNSPTFRIQEGHGDRPRRASLRVWRM